MGWVISHVAAVLASAFGLLAVMHLAGLRRMAEVYARHGYPRGYREVTGGLFAAAALLLAVPQTRLAGFGVAALVMFLTATTLLHRRQYGYAVPVVALLFALIPVSLGVAA